MCADSGLPGKMHCGCSSSRNLAVPWPQAPPQTALPRWGPGCAREAARGSAEDLALPRGECRVVCVQTGLLCVGDVSAAVATVGTAPAWPPPVKCHVPRQQWAQQRAPAAAPPEKSSRHQGEATACWPGKKQRSWHPHGREEGSRDTRTPSDLVTSSRPVSPDPCKTATTASSEDQEKTSHLKKGIQFL